MIELSFFDQPVKRRGTGCVKWDAMPADDVIPMWVADMDFAVAPAIQKAIKDRAAHPVFGYTLVPHSYYESVIQWFKRRHGWTIERDWILYTTGVVPAASATIKALTLPGEKVLVRTPAYNCFFSSIRNQGCEILETRLLREGDRFKMDFDDFERKCADEKTTVFLLCNPQNPTGRVWTREELERMNEICLRHHVVVVSDEIHNELVMPGYSYTPFASMSEACLDNSITPDLAIEELQHRRTANGQYSYKECEVAETDRTSRQYLRDLRRQSLCTCCHSGRLQRKRRLDRRVEPLYSRQLRSAAVVLP